MVVYLGLTAQVWSFASVCQPKCVVGYLDLSAQSVWSATSVCQPKCGRLPRSVSPRVVGYLGLSAKVCGRLPRSVSPSVVGCRPTGSG